MGLLDILRKPSNTNKSYTITSRGEDYLAEHIGDGDPEILRVLAAMLNGCSQTVNSLGRLRMAPKNPSKALEIAERKGLIQVSKGDDYE